MSFTFILPNQLFENSDILEKVDKCYIIEHPVFFTDYEYHKLKLTYHRASMKYYEDYISKKYKITTKYLEYDDNFENVFKENKNKELHYYEIVDFDIESEVKKYIKKYKIKEEKYDTPLFIASNDNIERYMKEKGHFINNSWYIWIRKEKKILVDSKSKPIGGKWSFDKENRLAYPEGYNKDTVYKPLTGKYINEAKKYIEKNFSDNVGNTNVYIPITHEGAKKQLRSFLKKRLKNFGDYQDAVSDKIKFGYHSLLSTIINVGLLTPEYVISETEKYYKKTKVKLSSVEGFIRQILGWREYMRIIYVYKYDDMQGSNMFKHKNKLNKSWYDGSTGIKPIDDIIKKVIEYGYAHHIERLMFLGNFMMLSEINPKEVFEWFMSLFIDAISPWVMYGNVYGMSQHSAGYVMATRPYFSSSNYVDKMSTYKKRKGVYDKINIGNEEYEWFDIWDALYYNFINNNKKYLSSNYSTANSVSVWNKKTNKEKEELIDIAKKYMREYM